MTDKPMLDLASLEELLDTFGADPARWPPAQRAPAEGLLAVAPGTSKEG